MGEDVDLGYHYDNAEITLNVSLGNSTRDVSHSLSVVDSRVGDQFEGGDLYFGTMAKATRTAFSNFNCTWQVQFFH